MRVQINLKLVTVRINLEITIQINVPGQDPRISGRISSIITITSHVVGRNVRYLPVGMNEVERGSNGGK